MTPWSLIDEFAGSLSRERLELKICNEICAVNECFATLPNTARTSTRQTQLARPARSPAYRLTYSPVGLTQHSNHYHNTAISFQRMHIFKVNYRNSNRDIDLSNIKMNQQLAVKRKSQHIN